FEEIVTRIRAQTDAAFVVSNLPDISRAPRVPDFLRADVLHGIRLYNERITDVAARQRLHLADTFEKSVAVIPSHPEFFSADGFHPSDEGYEFWAFEMWPVVKRALGWER
ncbi:MAG TPA: GDSL-type esterase/lipase family protein, partial [Pyrinomonadaceae bacterium]